MPVQVRCISTADAGAPEAIEAFRRKLAPATGEVVSEAGRRKTVEVFGVPLSPRQVVERICRDVRQRGTAAVLEYTAKLDGRELTAETLRVPPDELAAAHRDAPTQLLETVRRVRERVLRFQSAILHRDVWLDLPGGGRLGQRYLPLERVGICVPGGAAAYPSTVLMTTLPAQAAGVAGLAVVAPPTKFGSYNRDLLATCHELGITEVYRMGGAQAVAAMAYGTDVVPKVDKIVGPGNLFVALAKQHVFGEVDIDSIAGPSEVIVIADATTNPTHTAADLIAQAEHSPGASVLITWHVPLVSEVLSAMDRQLATLSRGDLARTALEEFGLLITVRDRDEAAALANHLATEHLHIACDRPRELLAAIRSAGAVFVGPCSPVATGDYAAGPSHVLPTGATARFASGLSSNSFLRSSSVIELAPGDLAEMAPDVALLAATEDLPGHGASVALRQPSPE